MTQAELIELARAAIQGSDAEIARRLTIPAPMLNRLKKKNQKMPDHIAVELAEIAGIDPALALACINAEKATDGRTRKVWQEVARRAAQTAAVALIVATGVAPPRPAEAGLKGGTDEVNESQQEVETRTSRYRYLYIMSIQGWREDWPD